MFALYSNPKYNPGPHGRRLKNRAPQNALQAQFAHPEVPPKGRLWAQVNSPGELLCSPTCNWTLRVHSFTARLNIALGAMGEDRKNGPQKRHCDSPWTIQKCPKRKALGTSDSPGEPLCSPTCNWTLRVRCFRATLNIALAVIRDE